MFSKRYLPKFNPVLLQPQFPHHVGITSPFIRSGQHITCQSEACHRHFVRKRQINESIRIYRPGMVFRIVSQCNNARFTRKYFSGVNICHCTSTGCSYMNQIDRFITYVSICEMINLWSIILSHCPNIQHSLIKTQDLFPLLHQRRIYQRISFLL